jgi:hypothetical protein
LVRRRLTFCVLPLGRATSAAARRTLAALMVSPDGRLIVPDIDQTHHDFHADRRGSKIASG